jgi:aryl-alcohol dehydrogenase-like predicted oxidoreductase
VRYILFGKTGLKLSTIGFGAWAIGGTNWGKTDDDVSLRALRAAIEEGVNFIDTADVYGFGHSEELISRTLKEFPGESIIVATKAGNDFYFASEKDDEGYGAIQQNYDSKYLEYAVEQSIKRLGRETIDILQLHSPDLEKLEHDEPWNILSKLKREGKIRFAGFSIQSFKESEQAHLLDRYTEVIDCIQVRYNLLERQAEKILFKKAMKYNMGVIVRIPLLFGFLTGKFDADSRFGEDDHRRMNLSPDKLKSYLVNLAKMNPLFERYSEQTKAQVSLRYCVTHPACHLAIPGAKTPKQVQENCSASNFGPLPPDEIPPL